MSKILLSDTKGGYNINAINQNFKDIEEVINDKVLFRDNPLGESNVMNNHLDMNGFLILNSPSLGGDGGGGGTGGNGTDGYSSALVYAYKRSATLPSEKPGAVIYDFANHAIIEPIGNDLGNGWTRGIPEGDHPLYVVVATASSQNITDWIANYEWSSPVILAKNGVSALNSAPIFIYQRTPTNAPPSLPSAVVQYVFGTGAITGLDNGWTSTIPPSFNGKYLWTCTATAVSLDNTDSISPAEWSAGQLLAQDGLDGMNGGADGLNNATFYAYKRSSTVPTDNPGPVTWHFPSARISLPSSDALANGWFKAPPAGTDQMYVVVASASSSTDTDDIEGPEWTTPAVVGSNGMNSATLYVYQRTASASTPAKPNNNVTYDFTTKLISGLSNNWSAAVPDTTAGPILWVTTATAASISSSDTILPTEWATPQQLAKDGTNGTNGTNGTSGTDGKRGTVNIAHAVTGSVWSNAAADTALTNAGYYPPINRDIVTQHNSSNNFSSTKFYDNGTWVTLTSYISGNLLVDGTLSASKISADTMTGQTYQTAVSGKRVAINEAGNNRLVAYKTDGAVGASLGGSTGLVYANNAGATTPAIVIDALGGVSGLYISGTNTSVNASCSSGSSANLATASGVGGSFSGDTAISASGPIVQSAYSETANKSIQSNNIIPVTDNTYYCGTLIKRWAGVTSASAVVVSSDARLKTDIEDTPLGLSFINTLRPVAYRLVEGRNDVSQDAEGNVVETSLPGVRKHYGLLAQEVKAALTTAGQEDAAFWILADKDNPDSQQALRYEELISPMIAAIKELSARVVELEGKVNGG